MSKIVTILAIKPVIQNHLDHSFLECGQHKAETTQNARLGCDSWEINMPIATANWSSSKLDVFSVFYIN